MTKLSERVSCIFSLTSPSLLNGFRRLLLVLLTLAVFALPAIGMEFSWVPKMVDLNMVGEIRSGDYEKFRLFILNDLTSYEGSSRIVWLSSNGGDLVETLKIATLLKTMYVQVEVSDKCASSCFFLYLSGTKRHAIPGSLGIHRAYFDPQYFSGLTLNDAEKRQVQLTNAVKKLLEDNSVPSYLIDRMNRTSSSDIYWLNSDEISDLGEYPSWFEELLIAKCGYDKTVVNRLKRASEAPPNTVSASEFGSILDAVEANRHKVYLCEEDFVVPELKKLRAILEISDSSLKKPEESKPPKKPNSP